MADDADEPEARPARRGITLFEGKDAPGLFESGTMSFPVFDPGDQEVIAADGPRNPDIALGGWDGVLFKGEGADGFSLVKAWFGPNYVLPRHTHDADCLYYVVEGSLTMGARTVGPGDGFFVPEGAPYGYEAGPDGVVVLEFRTRTSFGMNIMGGQVERLRKMAVAADENAETWKEQRVQFTG